MFLHYVGGKNSFPFSRPFISFPPYSIVRFAPNVTISPSNYSIVVGESQTLPFAITVTNTDLRATGVPCVPATWVSLREKFPKRDIFFFYYLTAPTIPLQSIDFGVPWPSNGWRVDPSHFSISPGYGSSMTVYTSVTTRENLAVGVEWPIAVNVRDGDQVFHKGKSN
jgi:hypothetical protein